MAQAILAQAILAQAVVFDFVYVCWVAFLVVASLTMAWRNDRYGTGGWSTDDDQTEKKERAKRDMSRNSPPSCGTDAIWTLSRRVAPGLKWFLHDLALLGESELHQELIEHLVLALKLMGSSLLPGLGTSPVNKIDASRSEVSELVGLLSLLAFRPAPGVGEKLNGTELDKGKVRQGGELRNKEDPWDSWRDPWSKNGDGKGSGKNDAMPARNLQGKGIFVPPPLVQTVEKFVEVPRIVEKIVEVPTIEYVEKIVEVERIVNILVEKIVEVPVAQTVEVEKVVHTSVEAAIGVDIACEAKEKIIRAECILGAPVAVHRAEFEKKIKLHQARHPGGRLPNELYDFSDYMRTVKHRLEDAEQQMMKCLSCGHFPWT